MRIHLLLLLAWLLLFPGCGKSKPDPRDHPNFIDTTDPNDLRMPGSSPPIKKQKPAGSKR